MLFDYAKAFHNKNLAYTDRVYVVLQNKNNQQLIEYFFTISTRFIFKPEDCWFSRRENFHWKIAQTNLPMKFWGSSTLRLKLQIGLNSSSPYKLDLRVLFSWKFRTRLFLTMPDDSMRRWPINRFFFSVSLVNKAANTHRFATSESSFNKPRQHLPLLCQF